MRASIVSAAASQVARLVYPERLEAIDILGPTIQFVTDPAEDEGPCIMVISLFRSDNESHRRS